MTYTVTLIPGDGIGPEVSDVARRCVEATGCPLVWEEALAGESAIEKYGTPLPDETLNAVRKNKVALKGPVTTPIGSGFRSVNVGLRHALDLYSCVRPCKIYPGVRTRYKPPEVNLVIVRENSEDLYAGIEFDVGKDETKQVMEVINQHSTKKVRPDSALSIKPISVSGTRRIATFAFEYARRFQRKKVTAVTKANIMKFTDGLFLRGAREVASRYPEIEYEEVLVDNMCMQLVLRSEFYDVLLLPNLYGDIISDLVAGMIGGLGMAPGANIGESYAVFEASHGSAPRYKNLNKVNPTALILSGVMMLQHLGETHRAAILEKAVADVIREGKFTTYDLRAVPDDPTTAGTREMGEAIVERVKSVLKK